MASVPQCQYYLLVEGRERQDIIVCSIFTMYLVVSELPTKLLLSLDSTLQAERPISITWKKSVQQQTAISLHFFFY